MYQFDTKPKNKPIYFLNSGKKVLDEIFSLIEKATESIEANFYHVADDEIGERFSEALIAKARSRVRVKLIYDIHGCILTKQNFFQKLKENGVELHAHNPYKMSRFKRFLSTFIEINHHKLLVIDNHIILIGGVNITGDFYGERAHDKWIDSGLVITNKELVKNVQKLNSFIKKGVRLPVYYIHEHFSFFHKFPWGKNIIHDQIILLIQSASRSLVFMHIYFLPSDDIVKALQNALNRGVSVTIILPGRYEASLLRWVIFARLRLLYEYDDISRPIKTFLWPGRLHSKIIIADEERAVLGSYNFDNRSKESNYENSIVVSDREVVHDIVSNAKEIISGSHYYEFRSPWYAKYKLKAVDRCIGWISRFL
jgi:cardiolipin synthase A/B